MANSRCWSGERPWFSLFVSHVRSTFSHLKGGFDGFPRQCVPLLRSSLPVPAPFPGHGRGSYLLAVYLCVSAIQYASTPSQRRTIHGTRLLFFFCLGESSSPDFQPAGSCGRRVSFTTRSPSSPDLSLQLPKRYARVPYFPALKCPRPFSGFYDRFLLYLARLLPSPQLGHLAAVAVPMEHAGASIEDKTSHGAITLRVAAVLSTK